MRKGYREWLAGLRRRVKKVAKRRRVWGKGAITLLNNEDVLGGVRVL